MAIVKSNKIELHYFFSDDSHGFDAIVRNECEKELLQLYYEISKALDLKLFVQSEPPKNGGFIDLWTFIGKNENQITLIISLIAIFLSRKPVENKRLTQLQIENLELDNELKKNELKKLGLVSITDINLNDDLIRKIIDILNLNYKIIWRRSNFFKKIIDYKRIEKISNRRFLDNNPVSPSRELKREDFPNFILSTDDLPDIELDEVEIDLISPVLKSGNFLWKGFINKQIVQFEMQDDSFKHLIQSGQIYLNSKVRINTVLVQKRKIDENGSIKINKSIVKLVIDYKINSVVHITENGQRFLDNKAK